MGAIADILSALLGDVSVTAVQRERLALAKDRVEVLEQENVRVVKENDRLKRRNTELEAEIAEGAKSKEFVEHRGAMFKRKSGGGYHQAVYCPSCFLPMSSLQGVLPYHCSCSVAVDFTGNDLKGVMLELES